MTSGAVVVVPVAFIVALAAIAFIRGSALARMLVDRPNERSLHRDPTPRIGGLGLLAGALVAMAVAGETVELWIAAIAIVLAAISALDDAESLPVATRLGVHFGAAALAVAIIGPLGGHSSSGSLAVALLALLAITWMANLFNFMDGADGLAGSMAAIGFAALALAAHRAGAPNLVAACAAIAAASAGFLVVNFPPAKVFMGDAGSVPLGFFAGALGWQGALQGAWPAWFPVLVFSPFAVDATLTLIRRLVAGEPVWKAHRSHYYQRLVLGGWSHRRLLLAQWALMGAAAASAIVAREQSELLQRGILAAWVLAYGVMVFAIDWRYPRKAMP